MFTSKNLLNFSVVLLALVIIGFHVKETQEYRLAHKLEQILYRSDMDSEFVEEIIKKWDRPIRIRVHGLPPEDYRPLLWFYIDQLRALTGLDITEVEKGGPEPNFNLHFAARTEYLSIAQTYDGSEGASKLQVDTAICMGVYFARRDDARSIRIRRGYAIVHKPLSASACLIEELTQLLGMPADTDLRRPSIFSEKDDLIRLSFEDKLLVRTFYDERIKTTMWKTEVLRTARKIFKELLAAAEKGGEAALIHPRYSPWLGPGKVTPPMTPAEIAAHRQRLERAFEARAREVWPAAFAKDRQAQ